MYVCGYTYMYISASCIYATRRLSRYYECYARAALYVRICLDVLQIPNNASTAILLAECILTSHRKYCDIHRGYLWGERPLCNQITNQRIEGTAKFILWAEIRTYQSGTFLRLLCTGILCIISYAMVCVIIKEGETPNTMKRWKMPKVEEEKL